MWLKVIAAVIPTGIAGILLDDIIDEYAHEWYVIAATLIIYGILFIMLENRKKTPDVNSMEEMSYKTAFLIGCCQILALIPGTSRSGSTILGAVFLGTSRVIASEISFFLAIPIMFGASLLKLLKFVAENGFAGADWGVLVTGTLVSYLVSIFAIKYLINYIKKHDIKAF